MPRRIVNERGVPFTRFGLHKLVRAIGERAGLVVHPHMPRHGCGYALADKGRDTRLIQDYLGHVDIGNVAIYTDTAAARFEGLWQLHAVAVEISFDPGREREEEEWRYQRSNWTSHHSTADF